MSAGDITPARRVDSMDDLERAGDYCLSSVSIEGVTHARVWFLLPIHDNDSESIYHREKEGSGLHGAGEPIWTVTEHEDGSVSIAPSLLIGRSDERPNGYWHGYLHPHNEWHEV